VNGAAGGAGAVRDAERTRVYAAEEAAFAGTLAEEPLSWAELEQLAADLLGALRRTGVDPGPVRLRRARRDAAHSSARAGEDRAGEIRFAPGHEAPATLTHELAHLVAGPAAGHGPRFRAAHLAVAGLGLGARGAEILAGEYARARLPVATRHPWPAVVPLPGWGLLGARHSGAIALGPVREAGALG